MLNYAGSKGAVKKYMHAILSGHNDGSEINCTTLAEEAWSAVGVGEEIHPDFYELSYDVACEHVAYEANIWI